MLFNYKIVTKEGESKNGSIEAVNIDVAISSLQRRGFVVSSIVPADQKNILTRLNAGFQRVSNREIVILSRQIATLFDANVSALRVFRLLSDGTDNELLRKKLNDIADDIQGGLSISGAMRKHDDVFTEFYVNMVKAGEESGKLNETFIYLSDYLDRTYELVSKTRNALIYPAFVIATFFAVMILMLVVVIPKLGEIITESGVEVPAYTKVVMGLSDFFVNYGLFVGLFALLTGLGLWQFGSQLGLSLGQIKFSLPYVGDLYRKFYLSRIADNMSTMLSSGIPMVRSVEITSSVVGDKQYENAMKDAANQIKTGNSVSNSFSAHEEIPNIMVQMIKVGEETGELGNILKTLSKFYKREVDNSVDTLVSLIEPAMIVLLGLGVGTLLASVMIPIYQISSSV